MQYPSHGKKPGKCVFDLFEDDWVSEDSGSLYDDDTDYGSAIAWSTSGGSYSSSKTGQHKRSPSKYRRQMNEVMNLLERKKPTGWMLSNEDSDMTLYESMYVGKSKVVGCLFPRAKAEPLVIDGAVDMGVVGGEADASAIGVLSWLLGGLNILAPPVGPGWVKIGKMGQGDVNRAWAKVRGPRKMGLFAKLPGELRNRIYRLALVAEGGVYHVGPEEDDGECGRGPCIHGKLSTGVPGILSTCRQIRAEAMPIFCSDNTFQFTEGTAPKRCPANWLHSLGFYGRLVREITVDVTVALPTGDEWRPFTLRAPTERVRRFITITAPPVNERWDEYNRFMQHQEDMNLRVGMVRTERMFWELLSSDIFADLIYACGQQL